MTNNGTEVTRSTPFYLGGDCPRRQSAQLARRTKPHEEYNARLLSYAEAARLLEVRATAQKEQDNSRAEVADAMREVAAAEVAAVGRIGRLESFVRHGRLADAYATSREVRTRHNGDGAESRRYRPKWVTWALWVTIVLAAGYDTAFLADMFLLTLDADWDWTSVTTYFALIPGVLIAVALFICGHFAAEAFRRSRAHTERTPRRIRRWRGRHPEQARERADMPWPQWGMAAGSLLVVLATLGVWAAIRGQVAGAPESAELTLPHWPMVMLVLLFSLAAVGMKILHHNPYIDRTEETKGQLASAKTEADEGVTAMKDGLARYTAAAETLRALGDSILGRAQQALAAALVAIMNERHDHGLAGDTATVFPNDPVEPAPGWVFHELIDPYVPTELPDRITTFLELHEPGNLRERWEKVMSDLTESADGRG